MTDTDDEKGLSYDGHHRRRALDLGAGRDRQLFFDVKGDDSYGMKRSSYRFARRIAGRGVRRW